MKQVFIIAFGLMFVLCDLAPIAAAEKYRGKQPPPMETIIANFQQYITPVFAELKVMGLHKKREGAYLVITNFECGAGTGPFMLLRLESNEWVMQRPYPHGDYFVFVKKGQP